MIKELEYINLEYTKKDNNYIKELTYYINKNSKEIINFFGIKDFGEKVYVKLFDDLENFRTEWKIRRKNNNIPTWVCGMAFHEEDKYNIYTLCLEEYKKTNGHNNDTLKELKDLILHEFVHSCHQKYTNNKRLPLWLSEGLATTLSHQYEDKELMFNSTLEQIINGGVDYSNYCAMFSYALDNHGRDYILKLLENKEYLQKETPILYEKVNDYYKNKKSVK